MNEPILIIGDGKAGHVNQSRAFCDSIGRPFVIAEVAYRTRCCKALAYLADRCRLRLPALYRFTAPLPPGPFAAVVCTGSTAFYPGKVTARRLGIPVAAILNPRGWRPDFDVILAPAFDNPRPRPNLITLPVNLTSVNPAFYAAGVAAFRERHAWEKPTVGVIIGGPNDVADMTAQSMRIHLDRVFAATEGSERWVTTSRRTPPEVEALVDAYPFDYKLLFSQNTFNPIPAFVSLCHTLFVTADSTGMISEAVTRGGAAVEILMNLRDPASKFARFVRNLESAGAAHVFDGACAAANTKVDLAHALRAAAARLGIATDERSVIG
jgi:mitochondrial fission protein ELM1